MGTLFLKYCKYFILAIIITVSFLIYHERTNLKYAMHSFFKELLLKEELKVTYQLQDLKVTTSLLSELLIDKNVKKILSDITPENIDIQRQKLFDYHEQTYKTLTNHNIKQFHFHLPNMDSFLRFHKPEKYGDNLKNIRESIAIVNKTKEAVFGFENGKIFSGFRNVYPIFNAQRFLGTIEISFSFTYLQNLLGQEKDENYLLLLKKSYVKEKTYDDDFKLYYKECVNPRYVIEKKLIKNCDQFGHFINALKKIKRYEKRALYLNDLLISIIPVNNFKDQEVGYIISFKHSDTVPNLQSHSEHAQLLYLISGIFLIFILLIIKHLFTTIEHSEYDDLTGIYNRKGFKKALAKYFDKQNGTLLMFDLDHFKSINDNFGHNTGDEVLKTVASIIKENIRKEDILCRWGGEEFILFLPHTRLDTASMRAEKIRQRIDNYLFEGVRHTTLSSGIAEQNDDLDLEALVKRADQKLYQAKEEGRNRVKY